MIPERLSDDELMREVRESFGADMVAEGDLRRTQPDAVPSWGNRAN